MKRQKNFDSGPHDLPLGVVGRWKVVKDLHKLKLMSKFGQDALNKQIPLS